jgi:hypothetical protein
VLLDEPVVAVLMLVVEPLRAVLMLGHEPIVPILVLVEEAVVSAGIPVASGVPVLAARILDALAAPKSPHFLVGLLGVVLVLLSDAVEVLLPLLADPVVEDLEASGVTRLEVRRQPLELLGAVGVAALDRQLVEPHEPRVTQSELLLGSQRPRPAAVLPGEARVIGGGGDLSEDRSGQAAPGDEQDRGGGKRAAVESHSFILGVAVASDVDVVAPTASKRPNPAAASQGRSGKTGGRPPLQLVGLHQARETERHGGCRVAPCGTVIGQPCAGWSAASRWRAYAAHSLEGSRPRYARQCRAASSKRPICSQHAARLKWASA